MALSKNKKFAKKIKFTDRILLLLYFLISPKKFTTLITTLFSSLFKIELASISSEFKKLNKFNNEKAILPKEFIKKEVLSFDIIMLNNNTIKDTKIKFNHKTKEFEVVYGTTGIEYNKEKHIIYNPELIEQLKYKISLELAQLLLPNIVYYEQKDNINSPNTTLTAKVNFLTPKK